MDSLDSAVDDLQLYSKALKPTIDIRDDAVNILHGVCIVCCLHERRIGLL